MLGLKLGIGMGNQRTRLAQPKAQGPKEPLALPHSQEDVELLLDPDRQGLPIPDSTRQAEIFWALAQGLRDLIELLLGESFWPARSISIDQASQAFLFKATNPALKSARGIAKQLGYFTAAHAVGNQQHPMKPMVVSCLTRTTDLILQGQDHNLSVGKSELSHA